MYQEGYQAKSRNSTSDTGSSAGNYDDPFVLLELRHKISTTIKKVELIETSIAGLDAKVDAKVSSLDSKLDAIFLSLSEVKKASPSEEEHKDQLLIFLQLKHTIEEVEQKYNTSFDHYLDTITKCCSFTTT